MCFIMVDLSLFFAIISAAALIRVESYQFGFFLLWPRVPILSLLCGHGRGPKVLWYFAFFSMVLTYSGFPSTKYSNIN